MTVALRYAARSDVGLVRSNNQDSAYAGPHLLMVADGMGGHAGGDVASSVAVAAFAPLDGESHGPDDALDELETALADARDEIIARSEADPDLSGMGTTRAGHPARREQARRWCTWATPAATCMRDGVLTQVTTDHTFVQHLVDIGRITPEEAEHHPQRSVVMRVLGDFDPEVTPDLSVREARPGDRWLLCSDGLSGFVSADTIEETMATIDDVDVCADRLVQLALRAGGGDNITVVLADVIELDDVADGSGPTTNATGGRRRGTDPQRPDVGGRRPGSPCRRARARGAGRGADRRHDAGAAPADEDDEQPRAPRRWRSVVVAVLIAAVVLGGRRRSPTRWTQTQYYVGADADEVVDLPRSAADARRGGACPPWSSAPARRWTTSTRATCANAWSRPSTPPPWTTREGLVEMLQEDAAPRSRPTSTSTTVPSETAAP